MCPPIFIAIISSLIEQSLLGVKPDGGNLVSSSLGFYQKKSINFQLNLATIN
jgi:hypothetical protein